MVRVCGLIPARGGSRRIPGKNTRQLNGHPLVAYTIAQARRSGIFDGHVYVSSDDENVLDVAARYGAKRIKRPLQYATDESPDICWVGHALEELNDQFDVIVILRPTNPFRRAATIASAYHIFLDRPEYDSLRAIVPASQHPAKMWYYWKFTDSSGRITPMMPQPVDSVPYYDRPTQSITPVYAQCGALQIHRRDRIDLQNWNLSGERIMGYVMPDVEALDINTRLDWIIAKAMADIDHGLLESPDEP